MSRGNPMPCRNITPGTTNDHLGLLQNMAQIWIRGLYCNAKLQPRTCKPANDTGSASGSDTAGHPHSSPKHRLFLDLEHRRTPASRALNHFHLICDLRRHNLVTNPVTYGTVGRRSWEIFHIIINRIITHKSDNSRQVGAPWLHQ